MISNELNRLPAGDEDYAAQIQRSYFRTASSLSGFSPDPPWDDLAYRSIKMLKGESSQVRSPLPRK
jgi:hypothetical protein